MDKSIQKLSKNLIELIDGDLYTGTWKLSKLFELEHKSLKRLVEKHTEEFCSFDENSNNCIKKRILTVDSKSTVRKRKHIEYLLTEPQSMYLILLSRNKDIVRKFKSYLTKLFFKQRKALIKLLAQKQNAEWLQKRESGKIERRLETDTIKDFVEYALSQGSKSASKYYMIISKMENHTLFNLDILELKYPNLRDILEGYQLSTLQNADIIVSRALKEGMEQQLFYKEIYKSAKERIERFVQLIGKTPIQLLKTETKALA